MSKGILKVSVGDDQCTQAVTKIHRTWHDYSFLIELKRSGDFASLFVDCPPDNDTIGSGKDNFNNEFVRVGSNSLEIVENVNVNEGYFYQTFFINIYSFRKFVFICT